MAAAIAKFAGSRILKTETMNHFGVEDPYYVYLTVEDKHGKKKTIKKRRYPPEVLSKNDKRIYLKVLRRQHRLDNLINLGFFKFGYSALIGLLPVIGDFTDYAFAVMLIRLCKQIDGGIPRSLEAKMQAHAMTALLIGFVPVAGDIVDAVYKANKRNAKYLADYLDQRALAIQKEHEGTATPDSMVPNAAPAAVGAGKITSPTHPKISGTPNRAANGQTDPNAPPLPNRRSRYRPTAGPGHGQDGAEIIIAPKIDMQQESGVVDTPPASAAAIPKRGQNGMTATVPSSEMPSTPRRSRFSSLFMTDRKANQQAAMV